MRNKIVLLSLLLISSIYATGQDITNDFEATKSAATKNNKHILLIFQGSDWCAPCIKLEKEIIDTEEFKKLSEKDFVIYKADFPRSKKHKLPEEQQKINSDLFETYNKAGYFPYVVVLDSNGKTLGALGYEKSTPQKYFDKLIAFK